jgi:DNA-binding IclR family transcriptional regulator
MTEWSFLTNHARVLVCIAHDPGVRLRDIATTVGITERSAYAIVADLTAAGYVLKDSHTDGRRNCYQIQADLPLPEVIAGQRTIGEVLDLLVDAAARQAGQFVNERTGLASPPDRIKRQRTSGSRRSQLREG